MPDIPEDILVCSGAGELPRLIIDGARAVGVPKIGVMGVSGSVERATMRCGSWRGRISFGNLKELRANFRNSGFKYGIFAGQISPLSYFTAIYDPEVRSILAEMGAHNAHTIFTKLIDIIEEQGVKILPSSLFLGAHIPKAGVLTKAPISEAAQKDLEFGIRIAMSVCDLDIGQTIVVKDGVTLAVEGFEGTDSTILRGGRIGRGGAMVIKVAKHDHDMRFDIPVVGMRTLRNMKRSGCSTIAVQAQRTLFLNLPKIVEAANRMGISIIAYDSNLPPAPTL